MNTSELSLFETQQLQAMIDGQLRPGGVSDHAVLANVASLPRGRFALNAAQGEAAYHDQPLSLNNGRSLLPPRTVARLVQALKLKESSRVLVIAASTGYEAALIAPMVAEVVACEDDAALQPLLRNNLRAIKSATALPNGPTMVPASSQPFTHVFVAAPFEVLPQALMKALPATLKLAGVRVSEAGVATALVMTRSGSVWLEEALFESPAGPVLGAFKVAENFVF